MPLWFNTFPLSRPKAALAFVSLVFTSSSKTINLESVLLRYVNFSTTLTRCYLMVMLGSKYCLPDNDLCHTSGLFCWYFTQIATGDWKLAKTVLHIGFGSNIQDLSIHNTWRLICHKKKKIKPMEINPQTIVFLKTNNCPAQEKVKYTGTKFHRYIFLIGSGV